MAIPRNKSALVAELIRKRLEHGDYSLTDIPAERTLALEHHVAYKTLRRAVQLLIDAGLLVRRDNGRLARNPKNGKGRRSQIAFLIPAFNSPNINEWCLAAERACARHGATLRPVTYVHWDDTIIRNTLNGFDGIFLMPLAEAMPDRFITRLKQSRHPVVVMEQDVSAAGIPSLCAIPPESVQLLLDHLAALGHQRIDCLNTQPMEPEVELRIRQWQIWLKAHGFKGRLLNHPVPSYGRAHDMARQAILKELDQGEPLAGAMICTTAWSAVGAMRAFHERKIQIGVEISVAAVNGEGVADCLCPSLTALEPGDPTPTLSVCLDWMTGGGKAWIGPLRVQVPGTRVTPRESTGRITAVRAPQKSNAPPERRDKAKRC